MSPGFRPLVCLAGTLAPFAGGAEDIVRRDTGVRLSASAVLRCTEAEGEQLRVRLRDGRMVEPIAKEPGWTAEGPCPRHMWAWTRSACRCKGPGLGPPSIACGTPRW